MSFEDAVPGVMIAGFVAAMIYIQYLFWRRRENAMQAFAERYGLAVDWGWGSAPDPGIRGLIFPAAYPRYMEGRIDGVPVVAFDYGIGVGRNARLGSGVGAKRQLTDPTKLFGRKAVRQMDGWTFVYSDPWRFYRSRLSAEEMERMLRLLLVAPARDPAAPVGQQVAGGLHIRPRRHVVE